MEKIAKTAEGTARIAKKNLITIFLVEDHPLTRSGLTHIINAEEDMVVCGEADRATTALEQIQIRKPDLVVADISLVDSTGIELVQAMRNRKITIPVLMISMHDEEFYMNRSVQAGANGYLFKRDSADQVTGAIREVISGKTYWSRSIQQKEQDNHQRLFDKLSNREWEIFTLLGKGKNRKEIADQLSISLKTVESHVDNMRGKLKVNSGFELVYMAIKQSLIPDHSSIESSMEL